MKKKYVVAVILAAGLGNRSGFREPKQLVRVAGLPIIEHTVIKFQKNKYIDEIFIVTNKECLFKIKEIFSKTNYKKVTQIIIGGDTRGHSSMAAIKVAGDLSNKYSLKLLFHDAVRPLISDRIISEVVASLDVYNAVDVAVPATDTVLDINLDSMIIESIPERKKIYCGQTPQGFSYEVIKNAYIRSLDDRSFSTTDDCGVVLKYQPNEKVYIVQGDLHNIKLTYEQDLEILDKLFQIHVFNSEQFLKKISLKKLNNKVIIILGGTSGIGKCIGNIATQNKAIVCSTSLSMGVDITKPKILQEYFKFIRDHYGKIDYVINTAAVIVHAPLADMKEKDIRNQIEVNYKGVIQVAKVAKKYLMETKGHLLNFTSSSYTYGRANYSIYSSTKAAVVNFTQAIADEWYSLDVRINCINPARTNTPFRRKIFGQEPIESLLTGNDVAEYALRVLLSNASGQTFDILKK